MKAHWSTIATILIVSGLITPTAFSSSKQIANDFSPYADMTINTRWQPDPEPMDLWDVSQKTGIKAYHLAFVTDAGKCSPAWGGISNYAITKDKSFGTKMTDTLRSHGVNYFVAFGGALGTDLSKQCDLHQLILVYELAITAYKPEGLDFDIENSTADISKVIRAIQEIQTHHPELKISFTVPVLPTGLVQEGRAIVQAAKSGNLTYSLNLMTMDYYGVPQCAGHMDQCSIEAATSVQKYLKALYPTKTDAALWEMLEMTPMIGVNDAPGESFTLSNAITVRDFAEKNKINGLSMWSTARDQPCSDKTPSPTCSGDNLQTKPYEFTKSFLSMKR